MAYLCGSCRKSSGGGGKRKGGKKKGKRKGKRRYSGAVSLSGAPVGTKSCKRAFATCVKKKRGELLKTPGAYGDLQGQAESYCRKTNKKVKKACKY
jgi:hypothetical protein